MRRKWHSSYISLALWKKWLCYNARPTLNNWLYPLIQFNTFKAFSWYSHWLVRLLVILYNHILLGNAGWGHFNSILSKYIFFLNTYMVSLIILLFALLKFVTCVSRNINSIREKHYFYFHYLVLFSPLPNLTYGLCFNCYAVRRRKTAWPKREGAIRAKYKGTGCNRDTEGTHLFILKLLFWLSLLAVVRRYICNLLGQVLLFQSIMVDVPCRSLHNWLIPLCIKRQLKSGHISEPASRWKLIWHVHLTYIGVYTGLDLLSLHLCRCIYTKQNLVLLLWYSTIDSAVSSYMCEWLVLNVIFVHTTYI